MSRHFASPNRTKKLKALAKLMNGQNIVPIPVTRALLRCFDAVITNAETDFLLRMGPGVANYEELFELSDLEREAFEEFLMAMVKRGLIEEFPGEDREAQFRIPAIAPGWFENHLSGGRDDEGAKEFARRFDNYIRSFSRLNVFPLRAVLNRISITSKTARSIAPVSPLKSQGKVIEVGLEIDSGRTGIYPEWDVQKILERFEPRGEIAVVHCFCRHSQKLLGEPCRFDIPTESCITTGNAAKYYVKYDMGRFISKSDAMEIIRKAEEKGAVHQIFYEREDMNLPEISICNCCWDCCGVFGSYNRAMLPAVVKAFYISRVREAFECTGCAICEEYCPVGAISNSDHQVEVDAKTCVGCGQCQSKCPEGVFGLERNERDVLLPARKKASARIPS